MVSDVEKMVNKTKKKKSFGYFDEKFMVYWYLLRLLSSESVEFDIARPKDWKSIEMKANKGLYSEFYL